MDQQYTDPEKLYNHAAVLYEIERKTKPEIRQALINKGATETEADLVVARLVKEYDKTQAGTSRKLIIYGGAIMALGVFITSLRGSMPGSPVFVAYGPIALGAYLLLRGLTSSGKRP